MKQEYVAAIAAALREQEAAVAAANIKFFATLKSIPGGEELLRRELAKRNLDPATIEQLLRGEIPKDSPAAFLGLNIGKS